MEICTQQMLMEIVSRLKNELAQIFSQSNIEVILFGSYARNTAEPGSDIDVLFLVDDSRESISDKNWQVGDCAADILLDFGVVVSPVVENRAYYTANADVLPFFRSIRSEGVLLSA